MTEPLFDLQKSLHPHEWLLVPHADTFQGNVLSPEDERLQWISGFTGSSGTALIAWNRALLFIDGRYTLQAKSEVSTAWEVIYTSDLSIEDFMRQVLTQHSILSFDPWLHTFSQYQHLVDLCQTTNSTLLSLKNNPIDRLWKDRPTPVFCPITPHSHHFAGESSLQKRQSLVEAFRDLDSFLFTDCQSIAWLLNIRGNDTPHIPIVHSYAILHKNAQIDFFVDVKKVTTEVSQHFGNDVHIFPIDSLLSHITSLKKSQIGMDPKQVPSTLVLAIQNSGGTACFQTDPSLIKRAIKNPVEIRGANSAHERDGIAIARFLSWLMSHKGLPGLTEYDCALALLRYKEQTQNFMGTSFETVSASGPQGAIIHYHPTAQSSFPFDPHGLYLIDAGSQYLEGTTDMTRTIALSEPTAEHRHLYTLVLKGHIALATCQFPQGTLDSQLDTLARQYLWQEGLNYPHGTGHGVGSYLSVHEGPQRIAPNSGQPLLAGMIVSNEPGYYQEGNFGIRLENLMLVEPRESRSGKPWLGFKTLTLVPFDRALIDLPLLTSQEMVWINDYHTRILGTLGPALDEEAVSWLKQATAPF